MFAAGASVRLFCLLGLRYLCLLVFGWVVVFAVLLFFGFSCIYLVCLLFDVCYLFVD